MTSNVWHCFCTYWTKTKTKSIRPRPRPVWDRSCQKTAVSDPKTDSDRGTLWMTICLNCTTLNFLTYLEHYTARCACGVVWFRGETIGNQYGPGTGTIWLDDVQCEGSESSLDNCQHNGWGDHAHCQHTDDVSIACYGSILTYMHTYIHALITCSTVKHSLIIMIIIICPIAIA